MVERCELTDLPKDGCAHCAGDTLGDEPNRARTCASNVMQAQYDTWCSVCSAEILMGQWIIRPADQQRYVHEECS